jgi:YVTN family beta-propeller protein
MKIGAKGLGFCALALGLAVAGFAVSTQGRRSGTPLVTGKSFSPRGTQTEVGSFPLNLAVSPDGKWVAVTDVGFRQYLTILDAETGLEAGKVAFNAPATRGAREGLYYGACWSGNRLYVAQGAMDQVSVFEVAADGTPTLAKVIKNPGPENPGNLPHHIAGLAMSEDGKTLFAVNNQSHAYNEFHGSVSALDVETGSARWKTQVGAFPMAVAAIEGKVYVASERDGEVAVIDAESGQAVKTIKVGAQPAYMLADPKRNRLFVTNSGSDTLSIVDVTKDRVVGTVLLRPVDLNDVPGSTPLGMALSADGQTMLVAMADLNAVAVVDLKEQSLEGFVDAGWYPTSVALNPTNSRFLVANGKGIQVRNPNGKPVRTWGRYVQDILEGTVASGDWSAARRDLETSTRRVLANNRVVPDIANIEGRAFTKPPVKYVFYVIKENRTYDQVLSDMDRGTRDDSLLLFGRDVTPNQHALADRFVLLDNFYVCGEVSADGWPWTVQGAINAYTARNVPYNYSRRGRNYDFEGTNNGTPVDLKGMPDVARHEGGYIWEAIAKKGLSIRNYGVFTSFGVETPGPDGKPIAEDNVPNKKVLEGKTCLEFKRYDMAYADSEAWVEHGLSPAPRQAASFGKFNDPSRMTAWLREFREYERNGKLPRFNMIRLGRDHTSGTSPGQYSPRACVADNDYAVGQLVEAISKSRYWKESAIFVLEDDAQAGFDHVDAHRSTAYVISPYIKPRTMDSRFYNTVSMLRTMGLILGVEPHNQYLATAQAFGFFTKDAANAEPFDAILPAKEIVAEVNVSTDYRAADSARLINRFEEESLPDIELNDILWGHMKGAKTPRPALRGARWSADLDD